ncbi:MAG: hypothetical protein ACRC3B_04320, partial [Bacteroidia bacterium]
MNKLQLMAATMLLSIGLNAQQFVNEYGNAIQDRASDISKTASGYIVAGNQNSGSAASRDLILIKMDENGLASSSPFFSNQYRLFNITNTAVRINNTQTVELPGGNILVAGSFIVPPPNTTGNGVYVAIFGPTGNVLSSSILSFPFPEQGTPVVKAMELSASGNVAFVCGTTGTLFTTGDRRDFAFALDIASNTLTWSVFYDNPASTNEEVVDMMLSPFSNLLIMVGNMTVSGAEEMYFRSVNPANGFVFRQSSLRRFGQQALRVAALTSNGNSSDPRILVCGNQQTTSTRRDVFVMSLDTTFSAVDIANVIPYSNGSSYQGNDILVLNPGSSQAEIIVSTDITSGLLGGNDVGILRLSIALVPINELTHGKPVTGETA